MKKYISIIALCLFVSSAFAQTVNSQKMTKDLEVAQTVLNSLVNDHKNFYESNQNDAQTQYIEGYGVILSLPKNHVFAFNFAPEMPNMPDISSAIAKSFEVIEDMQLNMSDEELGEKDRAEMEKERAERRKELALRQAELEKRAAIAVERAQYKIHEMDSMREQKVTDNTENVIDFLLDYGHLISQLKDSEKILVMEKGHDVRFYQDAGRVDKMKINRLSVEASMKDIRDFQAGKIDREVAKSRIIVNKKKEVKPLSKDLTLMKTILNRLYERDLSETYYLNSGMSHEQIDGLGVIFYMDMVSSVRSGNERWNIPTQDKTNLSQEQRDELIKSMYPKFEEGLISNILEYGKNIVSLEDSVKLIFKANITTCDRCNIPESLEIQVDSKTLKSLKSGKINETGAKKELKIIQGTLQ